LKSPHQAVRIPITSDADIVLARQRGRALATELGFAQSDRVLIVAAISELARNVIEYATKGEVILQRVEYASKKGIEIITRDEGPGIADVAHVLQDSCPTRKHLGLGLPGTKRVMDEFIIETKAGKGTTVTMKKWAS
jgi:serine/threonine-protein kinase RsbT